MVITMPEHRIAINSVGTEDPLYKSGELDRIRRVSYLDGCIIAPGDDISDDYDGESEIFVASVYGKAVGTVRVVHDSELRLPFNKMFPDEYHGLVEVSGRKSAEVSRLAVLPAYHDMRVMHDKGEKRLSLYLIREAFRHVVEEGIDQLFIMVNKRRERLYRGLYFERVGDVKTYHELNDEQAILMRQDVAAAISDAQDSVTKSARCYELHSFFLEGLRLPGSIETRSASEIGAHETSATNAPTS